MNVFALSGLVNSITSAFLGVLVYFKKGERSQREVTFSLFCAAVCWWSLFYFFWQMADDKKSALILCRTFMMGGILISPLFFHYNAILTETVSKYRKWIQWAYGSAFALFLANFSGLIVKDVEPRLTFPFWPIPGILFHAHLALFSFFVVSFVTLLFKSFKSSVGVRREQFKYSIAATLLGFGGGMTNYPLWYNIPIHPYGNFLVSLFVAIIAYTILRYKLMDINLAARYVTIYSFYMALLGIPFLAVGWSMGMDAGSFAVLFAAVILGPLVYMRFRDQIMNVVDRLPPFRDKYLKFDALQQYI